MRVVPDAIMTLLTETLDFSVLSTSLRPLSPQLFNFNALHLKTFYAKEFMKLIQRCLIT
jgi:hypothetical protein